LIILSRIAFAQSANSGGLNSEVDRSNSSDAVARQSNQRYRLGQHSWLGCDGVAPLALRNAVMPAVWALIWESAGTVERFSHIVHLVYALGVELFGWFPARIRHPWSSFILKGIRLRFCRRSRKLVMQRIQERRADDKRGRK